MGQKKGGGGGGGGGTRASGDTEEDLSHVPLQAILLADSFAQKFRPITLERPKVLLPLVNIPMIDYTLAWLESAGIEEVYVFCCAHSKQVIDYLSTSNWKNLPKFSVITIESNDSVSAGDALRLIYDRNVIHGDFVLISGDTVSNMSLTEALQLHKERKKKDSNAVMTMVVKKCKASSFSQQTRLGNDELFMIIDPTSNQLLYYDEEIPGSSNGGSLLIENALLVDNPVLSLHNDKQDCYIDICSPEVLSLFTDNFDYQHLRRHFVKGLLVDDIMGYKIFTHEIHSSYASRVDNFRSYDTISKDILQRWTYPFVPDVQFSGNRPAKLERQGMYKEPEVEQSHSAQIGPFTLIGKRTKIGDHSIISNSVIGEGCKIGSNVSIEGSYIWNNVTIEDGCKVRHAIVCDGVVMKSGAVLEPGVILSFKVIIGEQFVVPAYSKVSTRPQPTNQDSDEELEYAESTSLTGSPFTSMTTVLDMPNGDLPPKLSDSSEVGVSGVGFIWSSCEGGHEEEWRHSVAPVPADKLAKLRLAAHAEQDLLIQEGSIPPSGELIADSDSVNSEDASIEDYRDDSISFEKEVESTFLRAVHEGVDQDHVIIEVNQLRLTDNRSFEECAGALFHAVMKLALETPHKTSSELLKNAATVINKWSDLLKHYLPGNDEQIEMILKFQEICLDSAKEFAPIFSQVLHQLYENEVLTEEAILKWASEQEGAEEFDKVFVKQSEQFIQWLIEAPEEEDDDEDE